MKIWIVEMQTGNFIFFATGVTRESCMRALQERWNAHRKEYADRLVLSWQLAKQRYQPEPVEIELGKGYRDGE